jgi:hypothetical protein
MSGPDQAAFGKPAEESSRDAFAVPDADPKLNRSAFVAPAGIRRKPEKHPQFS